MSVENYTNPISTLSTLRLEKAKWNLFTKKQGRIIEKIMRLEKLDSNENQTYSRTIKPRINAIIDFYDIALAVRSKE